MNERINLNDPFNRALTFLRIPNWHLKLTKERRKKTFYQFYIVILFTQYYSVIIDGNIFLFIYVFLLGNSHQREFLAYERVVDCAPRHFSNTKKTNNQSQFLAIFRICSPEPSGSRSHREVPVEVVALECTAKKKQLS